MNVLILIILILVALSCALPGIFLNLKKLSMISDAISHTILLGIVLGFALSYDINSPLVMIGAVVIGIITALLINLLSKNKKVNYDASCAIVFPFLFAIAIVLINLFFENVHLDVDSVLLGEVIYAPLNTVKIGNFEIPVTIINSGILLIVNTLFILLFYRGLKTSSFSENDALLMGFKPNMINILLMIIISLTAVISFDSVGSVLVIALLIAPSSIALLFANNLKQTIVYTISFSVLGSVGGYLIAIYFDVSIAGSIATLLGIMFILGCLFRKKIGLLNHLYNHNKVKQTLYQNIVLKHLQNPISYQQLVSDLNIKNKLLNKTLQQLYNNNQINYQDQLLVIKK